MVIQVSDSYIGSQAKLNAASARAIKGLRDIEGQNIAYIYRGLAISESYDTDISACIGIPALAAISRFGIPGITVAKHLGEVVRSGVIMLGLKVDRWNFKMPVECVEPARAWLLEGSQHQRSRRVKELLGISERRVSRYLLIDENRHCTTTDNISDVRKSVMLVLDAFVFADEVLRAFPGHLFTIEQKGVL